MWTEHLGVESFRSAGQEELHRHLFTFPRGRMLGTYVGELIFRRAPLSLTYLPACLHPLKFRAKSMLENP